MTSGSELAIVSFIGAKGVGKSFLLDSVITHDSGKVSRVWSRSSKPLVLSTTYRLKGNSEQ